MTMTNPHPASFNLPEGFDYLRVDGGVTFVFNGHRYMFDVGDMPFTVANAIIDHTGAVAKYNALVSVPAMLEPDADIQTKLFGEVPHHPCNEKLATAIEDARKEVERMIDVLCRALKKNIDMATVVKNYDPNPC